MTLLVASFAAASGQCLPIAVHNDRESGGLCGPVKEVRQVTLAPGGGDPDGRWPALVTLYDRKGTLMATFNEPPRAEAQRPGRVRHELDARGRIVRSSLGGDGKTPLEGVTFRYDGLRVTGAKTWRGDAAASSRTVFEYDSAGRLVRARTTGADGSVESERRSSYDAAGRIVERVSCDAGGCFDKEALTYGDDGRLTDRTIFYPDGETPKLSESFVYDAEGNLAHVVETEAHDEGLGIGEVLVTWGSRGDEIRATRGIDGRERGRILTKWGLDASGNWIRALTYQCPPGATDTATCSEGRPVTREITYYLDR